MRKDAQLSTDVLLPYIAAPTPALAEALAKFQAELPSVGKNEEGDTGHFKYEYASLDLLVQRVLPKLAAVGLSFTCATDFTPEGKFVLTYALLHTSGESRLGMFPIPVTANAQQMGSWLTYARRYCLLCVTGVHPGGEDDDAVAAMIAPTPAAADHGAVPRPAKPEEKAEPEHVNEKAQVLASLAQELVKRNCSLDELKGQVYEVARGERLLKAMVINPWTGTMVQLSTVITYARKTIEDRSEEGGSEAGGEY